MGRSGGEVLLGPTAVLDRDLIMMMVGWYAFCNKSDDEEIEAVTP